LTDRDPCATTKHDEPGVRGAELEGASRASEAAAIHRDRERIDDEH
jgi:hypothetical protein